MKNSYYYQDSILIICHLFKGKKLGGYERYL